MTEIRTIQTVTGPTLTVSVPAEFAGQQVEISMRPVTNGQTGKPGDGLLRKEGALADEPHWDATMEEIYQERKSDTRTEISE